MYARSNTLMGNPRSMDEGIAYIRDEVMPMVQGMDGFVGLSMLCDRDTGRCIVTTAWESEEAMRASDQGVRDSRARAAEIFGGAAPEVREWEIALMHRRHEAHHGACARVLWGRGDPARMADALETARTIMPRMEELPGFCSVSMMVDRTSGRSATSVTYDNRDDMMRAADQGRGLREEFTRATGGEITEVAEFDLEISHLRVPETV
jgi:heme-degrading monooxygenase HmoA